MAKNITFQTGHISKQQRAEALNQKPCCIWLTGLSGAGKSTLAYATELALHQAGRHVYVLDGDNVRQVLSQKFVKQQDAISARRSYSASNINFCNGNKSPLICPLRII